MEKPITTLTEEDPDNWWTPQDLFDEICKEYNVKPQLDVCADKYNAKCLFYFDKEDDALNREWVVNNVTLKTKMKPQNLDIGQSYPLLFYPDIWCNAPGKDIQKFVNKAYEQWNKHKRNYNILMLIPLMTAGNKEFEYYWDLFIEGEIEIRPLFGIRPKFKDARLPDNRETPLEPKFGSRNAYMILKFPKV